MDLITFIERYKHDLAAADPPTGGLIKYTCQLCEANVQTTASSRRCRYVARESGAAAFICSDCHGKVFKRIEALHSFPGHWDCEDDVAEIAKAADLEQRIQDGCEFCKRPIPVGTRYFLINKYVDAGVRGSLCPNCNDDIQRFLALRRPDEQIRYFED
jgi:hypothetical protein